MLDKNVQIDYEKNNKVDNYLELGNEYHDEKNHVLIGSDRDVVIGYCEACSGFEEEK